MIYVVLFFLFFSLYLYVTLGGADYGAGILELFSSKKTQKVTKKTIYRVIGPVWEANHIWVIILIVIMWIAFPSYYNKMVIHLHIPITLVLLGITGRGVAFVFRHYDAKIDKSQRIYDSLFKISSLITPIFLGMVFGGMITGKIPDTIDKEISFYAAYVHPWFNVFSFLVGCFFAAICTFLSSILLIGEASLDHKHIYIRKATLATLTVCGVGFITLLYGYTSDLSFVEYFVSNPIAMGTLLFSALLLFPLAKAITKGRRVISRFLAGFQVFLILSAALWTLFPEILITNQTGISILENKAPSKVIDVLGYTLLIGGILILPGLFHLLKSFKMIKILDQKKSTA